MPDGGALTIETENVDLTSEQSEWINGAIPGSYVRLSVTNTGSGMSTQVLEKLFDPFFTPKEVGKGTGLGMSVVHGILKSHGALIEIDTENGVGTSIQIYFLVVDEAIAEGLSEDDANVVGGSETILLVEDDAQVRRFATHILSKAGYAVITALDGVDGLGQYRANGSKIQLVLTDVVMPRSGGQELMKCIREIDDTVPIVFSSGYLADEAYTEFLREGIHELIQKPYSPAKLLGVVRRELDCASGN